MTVTRIRRRGVSAPVVMANRHAPHVYAHVPPTFRLACRSAQLGAGYLLPGYRLMALVDRLVPDGCTVDQWVSEVSALWQGISQRDDSRVLEWFIHRYPACMALVPSRRYDCFVRGVYQQADHTRVEEQACRAQ